MAEYNQEQEQKQQYITEAKAFLQGEAKTPEDALRLAKKLKDCNEFGRARLVLQRAAEHPIPDYALEEKMAQERALLTYKDPQLNREQALRQAIGILQDACQLDDSENQETLGLAGAIYKRRWEVDGDETHLRWSLHYYSRGVAAGIAKDDGYTAINAAFIHELLAYLGERQALALGIATNESAAHRNEAATLRTAIVDEMAAKYANLKPKNVEQDYWPLATLAEACFGLGSYAEAGQWLDQIKKIPHVPDWQIASTAKQLVQLSRFQAKPGTNEQNAEKSPAWKTLVDFIGKKAYALQSMFRGKVGLALSGGGFRASLYHIGVLAKLAEYDLLRHVEVLSCVSGGSIIGAHYYLELRRLINVEKKSDAAIGRGDFIGLIETIADDFLVGVQENPRVRLLANPWTNLKMIFDFNYSRTQRLGELYEALLYSRVEDGEGITARWLNNLHLYPDGNADFSPRRDNWSLRCKIPELVLNATTLNTGHNWQFTATSMGESLAAIDVDFDKNDRYPRTWYEDAPDPYKKMRLGYAVAASSCVPGLFEPLILPGLFKDARVRLVDGGIYDNQGIESLLEQDCDVIIASDASGQLSTEQDPGGGVVKPLLRSNNTVMERVRNNQFEELKSRVRAGILKGFAVVHLKQGLKARTAELTTTNDSPAEAQDGDAVTPYGIRDDVQRLLSAVRTDLDSFSELEAYALMSSGYLAMGAQLREPGNQALLAVEPGQNYPAHPWKFLQIEATMQQPNGADPQLQRLKQHLAVSRQQAGKVWKLYEPLKHAAMILAAAAVAALLAIVWTHPGWKPFSPLLTMLGNLLTIRMIVIMSVMLVLIYAVSSITGAGKNKLAFYLADGADLPRRIGVGLGIGLIGWVAAYIHLQVFDRWFKADGRVKQAQATK